MKVRPDPRNRPRNWGRSVTPPGTASPQSCREARRADRPPLL